jgi:hypothetical protein
MHRLTAQNFGCAHQHSRQTETHDRRLFDNGMVLRFADRVQHPAVLVLLLFAAGATDPGACLWVALQCSRLLAGPSRGYDTRAMVDLGQHSGGVGIFTETPHAPAHMPYLLRGARLVAGGCGVGRFMHAAALASSVPNPTYFNLNIFRFVDFPRCAPYTPCP